MVQFILIVEESQMSASYKHVLKGECCSELMQVLLSPHVLRDRHWSYVGSNSDTGQTIDHYLTVVIASLLGAQGCGDSITTGKPVPE